MTLAGSRGVGRERREGERRGKKPERNRREGGGTRKRGEGRMAMRGRRRSNNM